MPIETSFGCQRARSALSLSVLKPRHNTLILLPNSAKIGTTCCLQRCGKLDWNCSASDKILINFCSAIIKLPTMTIQSTKDVTPSFEHSQQGQGSSGTFTSPGLYQAWICQRARSRVEASKGSPSPEESKGPLIISSIAPSFFRRQFHIHHL